MKRGPVSELVLDPDATIGERVRYYRLLRGYTQEWLANECGTSTSRIREIEKDQCSPRTSTLRRIADVLEIDLEVLTRKSDLDILEGNRNIFMDNLRRMVSLFELANSKDREFMTIQSQIMAATYENMLDCR